jgi:hypothetical protein
MLAQTNRPYTPGGFGSLLVRTKVRAGFYRVGTLCIHKGYWWSVYHEDKLLERLRTLDDAHWWASNNQPKGEAPC